MIKSIQRNQFNGKPRLSIIIPVYNEEKTLAVLLDKVLSSIPDVYEIIAVDDASSDTSSQILRELSTEIPALKPIFHAENGGKTAALRTGISASSGDVIIVQDADLEYDPADIPNLIAEFTDPAVDAVYGSRFTNPNKTGARYIPHFLANRFLTSLSNLFTGYNLTDMETCYKAIRGDLLRDMTIHSERFGFEVEVTSYLAKHDAVLREMPISYQGRSYSEGKKIGFRDGVMAVWYILKYHFSK